jgi:hypothetical protein
MPTRVQYVYTSEGDLVDDPQQSDVPYLALNLAYVKPAQVTSTNFDTSRGGSIFSP